MFPILVVSPAYLTGAITLGALIQAHLAFQRVEGAFAFCIGAYPKIAEWKAIMDRLAQFEAAMTVVDALSRSARARSRSCRRPGAIWPSTIWWCGSPRAKPIAAVPGDRRLRPATACW